MEPFDWLIINIFGTLGTNPPQRSLNLLPSPKYSCAYSCFVYVFSLYTLEMNFGQIIWDKTQVLWGTFWGTHLGTREKKRGLRLTFGLFFFHFSFHDLKKILFSFSFHALQKAENTLFQTTTLWEFTKPAMLSLELMKKWGSSCSLINRLNS